MLKLTAFLESFESVKNKYRNRNYSSSNSSSLSVSLVSDIAASMMMVLFIGRGPFVEATETVTLNWPN